MTGIVYAAFVLVALAQPAPAVPPAPPSATEPPPSTTAPQAAAEAAPPPPPRVQMLAIQATKEGRAEPFFDEALKELEEPLRQLPFDTFKQIASEQKECPLNQEATFNVDDAFRVVVRTAELPAPPAQPGAPPAQPAPAPGAAGATPQPQALMVHGRVEMKEGDSYLNALSADAILPANQFLMFRGIPRENGELLALITPSMGQQQQQQQEQQQQEQDEQDQQEQQQDQEQKQDEEKQQEGQTQPDKPKSEENQEQEQQMSEAKEDEDKPKDMQNIEAILQSLEELDEQEQHKLREVPNVREVQGAWW